MTSILSERGLEDLKQFLSIHQGKLLFAFDYDGTLSSIVKDPTQTQVRPELNHQLKHLSSFGRIAVISGRGLQDLRSRISFPVDYWVGNHGLEGAGVDAALLESAKTTCRDWMQQLNELLTRAPELICSVFLEDKVFSISVHYRDALDSQKAQSQLLENLSQLKPQPRIVYGKAVFNLVIEGFPDKGDALFRLMRTSGASGAIYLGDDCTDEDVFKYRDPNLFTIRIEKSLETQARYYLEQQSHLEKFIEVLLNGLQHAELSIKTSAI